MTATAVPLAENSAFGTTALDQNGNPVRTGKTVQGLNDSNSAGTNISTVVDENNNTYVLSIDGKRFGITVHGC